MVFQVTSFYKSCSMCLANKRFSSSMLLHITLKLIIQWNSCSALLVVKWLLTNMCSHVYVFSGHPLDKSCHTLIVNQRFFSFMCCHMGLQMTSLCKSWTTLDAAEGLCSSIYAHVLLQVTTYYKSCCTFLACKWFYFSMFFLHTTLKLVSLQYVLIANI